MTASDNTQPNVSIVIPCRNERDHIETVLRSILNQNPPLGGFEVIIGDGMSDDCAQISFGAAAASWGGNRYGTPEILTRSVQNHYYCRFVEKFQKRFRARDDRGISIIAMRTFRQLHTFIEATRSTQHSAQKP